MSIQSRPVRVRPDVAARVAVVAEGERRSFANMVEVLLLAALAERAAAVVDSGPVVQAGAAQGRGEDDRPARSASADPPATVQTVRPHMKKNRPAVECSSRTFVDGACPDCGLEE